MDNVKAFLYDASGEDEQVELEDIEVSRLRKDRLLWIDVYARDEDLLEEVTSQLKIENVPCGSVLDDNTLPELEKYGEFFRFCVDSIITEKDRSPRRLMVDYIVGKNFVVTIHEGQVGYLEEFRELERGESRIGELDAESFVAALLDLNIVTYFAALGELDRKVDDLDEQVLKEDVETEDFLKQMVSLRRDASKLRRWLMPQREIYYALSRADFQQIAESDSVEQYRVLTQHFDSAVEAIDHARESVLGVFELYATKSTHMTNILVQRLTFITVITGLLAVIAGVLGMTFHADIFEMKNGFWLTTGGLFLLAAVSTIVARVRRWI